MVYRIGDANEISLIREFLIINSFISSMLIYMRYDNNFVWNKKNARAKEFDVIIFENNKSLWFIMILDDFVHFNIKTIGINKVFITL